MPIFVHGNMDRPGCTMLVSVATNIAQDVQCQFICCNADRPGCTMQIFGLRNMDRQDVLCNKYRSGCTMPVDLLQLRSAGCTMKIFGLRSMDRPRCTMLVSVAKRKKKKRYRSGCTMPVAVCICCKADGPGCTMPVCICYKADRPRCTMPVCICCKADGPGCTMPVCICCKADGPGCTMPVCICCKADGPGCTTAVLYVAGPVLRPQTPVLEGRGGRVQDRTNSSTGRVCSQYVSVSLHPLLCLISACALLNVFCERLRSLCNRVCCLFMTRWLSRVKCIPSSSSSSSSS